MELVIRPKGKFGVDLKEIWSYRELFYFLAWRDIKVRYKQTVFGASWAILQPLLTMVVFTILFGKIAGISSNGVPYPIFSYTGLIFWQFFSSALSNASNSFVANQSIMQKIYFPRLIMPVSATIVSFLDFMAATTVFVGLMVYYQITPSVIGILLIPFALLISFITASGLGLLLATLNVKYRDVRHALPFFIQLLLFLTPVIYPVSVVSAEWRWILSLNPMSGVIETMRAGLLNIGLIDYGSLLTSTGLAITIFIIGYIVFYKHEREFADVI